MRKITVKQYAESLYQATKDLGGKDLKAALENFVKLLAANRDLKQADKIVNKFKLIYNDNEKIEEAEVISRQKFSENIYLKIEKMLAKDLNKKITLIKKVDNNLLGGFIIKYQDVILDGSLNSRIKNLTHHLLK